MCSRGPEPGRGGLPEGDGETPTTIGTVNGPIEADAVRLALPREHLLVDLLCPTHADYCWVDWARVRDVCVERLAVLRFGVDLLVDCTPMGIGRNVGLLRDVSEATGIRITCATGIYKGHVPPESSDATPGEMAARFVSELTTGIDGTGVRAGVIKLATTETGPTPRDTEVHRAGARAGAGSAIVLHSPQVQVARGVLATLEAEVFAPARLTWAHGQESTAEDNLELAARRYRVALRDRRERRHRDARPHRAPRRGRPCAPGRGIDRHLSVGEPARAGVRAQHRAPARDILPLVESRLGAALHHSLVRGNVLRTLGRSRPPAERHWTDRPSTSKEG